jgi:YegS/Rv2252/BmrU family lipid kinase
MRDDVDERDTANGSSLMGGTKPDGTEHDGTDHDSAEKAAGEAKTVLIVNGAKADAAQADALRESVARAFAQAGLPSPQLAMTTPEDCGTGMARAAVRDGATLVVACGGDGTVNAVAEALAGTQTVLGVVPLGTGNLLAGHLRIPQPVDEAVALLTEGADRRLDLGTVGDRVFVGMAGLGLDAAMIADSSEDLKARIGWLAYVPSIVRHLRDRGRRVTLLIDGRRVRHSRVKALIIGNFGQLHGGIDLMPEAKPDDGMLDVVVLEPSGKLAGWFAVLVRLLTHRDGRNITRYQGRRVQVRTRRPVPLELDGDPYRTANSLSAEAKPGALIVRAPASEPVEHEGA